MNKLTFDINVPVSISNGINLKQLGSLLQSFTTKYLYIINDKLYGIEILDYRVLRGDLKNKKFHLIGYDMCFELKSKDMRTMLYCFNKELADFLDSSNKPRLPTGLMVCDPVSDIPEMDNQGVECNGNIDEELGNLSRKDPRTQFDINIKQLIARDKERLERTIKEGEQEKGQEKEKEKERINQARYEQERLELIDIGNEIQDTMAQSRQNETDSLAAAIRQRRNRNKNKIHENNNLPPKEKEEMYEQNNDHTDDMNKVCSVVDDLLRKKVNKKDQDDNYESDNYESDSDDHDSENGENVKLPIIPRIFSDEVKLSNLPDNLQRIIIKTFTNPNSFHSFYFNGGNFSILFENNTYSIYDWDNVLSVDRLRPNKFKGEYDGTPGSLPIAQFTKHEFQYNLYWEPKDPKTQGMRLNLECLENILGLTIRDIREFMESNVYKMVSDNSEYLLISHNKIGLVDKNVSCEITIFRSLGSIKEAPEFWPLPYNDDFTIICRRADKCNVSNDTYSDISDFSDEKEE